MSELAGRIGVRAPSLYKQVGSQDDLNWRRGLEQYYLGLGRWACPIGSLTTQLAATDAETAAFLRAA